MDVLNGKKAGEIPVKVFKDDLNVYVNEKDLKDLGIELPAEVKNNDKLIMVTEKTDDQTEGETAE